MISLTLKEEVTAHHARLTDPKRTCEKCHQPPLPSESLQIGVVTFVAASVPFSICNRCVSEELVSFADQAVSHEAAGIFTCSQQPAGIDKLCAELVDRKNWLDRWSDAGRHCDECSVQLERDEPVSTVLVAMTGAITDRSVLYVVCLACSKGKLPNIKARCDNFLARIVSNRATAFIPDLLSPRLVVN